MKLRTLEEKVLPNFGQNYTTISLNTNDWQGEEVGPRSFGNDGHIRDVMLPDISRIHHDNDLLET